MSWRPKEGWKNPYREFSLDIEKLGENHISLKVLSEKEAIEADKYVVYEAGADGLLEALKKGMLIRPDKWHGRSGWIVFIPEEGA